MICRATVLGAADVDCLCHRIIDLDDSDAVIRLIELGLESAPWGGISNDHDRVLIRGLLSEAVGSEGWVKKSSDNYDLHVRIELTKTHDLPGDRLIERIYAAQTDLKSDDPQDHECARVTFIPWEPDRAREAELSKMSVSDLVSLVQRLEAERS